MSKIFARSHASRGNALRADLREILFSAYSSLADESREQNLAQIRAKRYNLHSHAKHGNEIFYKTGSLEFTNSIMHASKILLSAKQWFCFSHNFYSHNWNPFLYKHVPQQHPASRKTCSGKGRPCRNTCHHFFHICNYHQYQRSR